MARRPAAGPRAWPGRAWLAALLVLACLGPAMALAQHWDSPNQGPFNTRQEGEEPRLMLEGHDPVAYFVQNEAVRGDPHIQTEHLGQTWRFASTAHRALFLSHPEKYMPQFGGYCALGMSQALPRAGAGGPNTWRIYRGKLYLFGGQRARDQFEMDTEAHLTQAHRLWREEVASRNALWVRVKRSLMRVPHYRSERSLQAEWEARLAARNLPVMPGMPQVVPAAP